MANAIKLLDVVALTIDLPEYNLRRGQVGTVVEILAGGTAFEVEFSDREGRRTSRSGCVQISSRCCTTNLSQRNRSLRQVHRRALLLAWIIDGVIGGISQTRRLIMPPQ